MKGIILAGGIGKRLYPISQVACKQLMPVYDKPMIYYPLTTLMLAGIREILIISTPEDVPLFEKLLGDGSSLGLKLSYQVQQEPRGIAEAFILGEAFIGDDQVCLILGDNVFFGYAFSELLQRSVASVKGATIFGYRVNNPEEFGIVECDADNRVLSLEEKPVHPKSNHAVVGLYFYDNSVVQMAKGLQPSARGELEITDLNRLYLDRGELHLQMFGRGFAWLDTGTPQSMMDAGNFIATIEKRQGLKIGCVEEVAYRMGYIDDAQLDSLIQTLPDSSYKEYLIKFRSQD